MIKKHHDDEEVKKESHLDRKPETPVEPGPKVDKTVDKPVDKTVPLKETLIYLRDNVVQGNEKHVALINKALGG